MSKQMEPYRAVIQFSGYIFEQLSFEYKGYNGNSKEHASDGIVPTSFQVGVGIEKDEETMMGDIRISCHINEEASSRLPFSVVAIMRGKFSIDSDIDEKQARKLLEINGVAVMFPFLRAGIASLTTAAGVDAMVLPLFDLHRFMKDKELDNS